MRKSRIRPASFGRLIKLVGLGLALIFSISAQQPDLLQISVYVPPTSNNANLESEDFELRVDGQVKDLVSAEHSLRPLSVVILFITNTSGCVDSLAPFSSVGEVNAVFGDEDQVAVVVSDEAGTVVRSLSKAGISLSSDLSKAVRIADRNSSESLNLENGTYESKQGLIFAMKGLEAAIRSLNDSPEMNDKVIVFVNDLQNTREGTRNEAQVALSSLVEKKLSVSWLTTRNFDSRFWITRIPYGQRDFFFALPDASGGIVRGCREAKESTPVVWGRSRTEFYSFENDLKKILQTHRNRYTLRFRKDEAQPSVLKSVSISLQKAAPPTFRLVYPRAIKY